MKITINSASRKYKVSQLCIWGLIRQKKLKATTELGEAVVSEKALDKFMKDHPAELEQWRQIVKPDKPDKPDKLKFDRV